MQPPDLISLFLVPLNRLDVPYMITGAVAAFPADAFYAPPPKVVEEEARRPEHGHFNLIHHETALKADCYVVGEDPLHQWALGRRVRHEVGGVPIWVAPIEYVILRKLQWYGDGGSTRHLEDTRGMLLVSGASADRPAVEGWIARPGLEKEWQAAT